MKKLSTGACEGQPSTRCQGLRRVGRSSMEERSPHEVSKPELGEGHLEEPAQVSEPRQGGEKRVHAGSGQQWRGETGYTDREVDQINTSDRKDWGNLISHHQSKELQI